MAGSVWFVSHAGCGRGFRPSLRPCSQSPRHRSELSANPPPSHSHRRPCSKSAAFPGFSCVKPRPRICDWRLHGKFHPYRKSYRSLPNGLTSFSHRRTLHACLKRRAEDMHFLEIQDGFCSSGDSAFGSGRHGESSSMPQQGSWAKESRSALFFSYRCGDVLPLFRLHCLFNLL